VGNGRHSILMKDYCFFVRFCGQWIPVSTASASFILRHFMRVTNLELMTFVQNPVARPFSKAPAA